MLRSAAAEMYKLLVAFNCMHPLSHGVRRASSPIGRAKPLRRVQITGALQEGFLSEEAGSPFGLTDRVDFNNFLIKLLWARIIRGIF